VHGDQTDDDTYLGHGGGPRRRGRSNDDLRQHRTFTDCTLADGHARTGAGTSADTRANADTNTDTDADSNADPHAHAGTSAADFAAVTVEWWSAAGDDFAESGAVEQSADPELHVGQYLDVHPDHGQRRELGAHRE